MGHQQALIEQASKAVRKRFRSAISQPASEALELPSVWASTGSFALDQLCAGHLPGGLPLGPHQGRVVHIAGEWACGKSVLLDHLFKTTQDLGGLGLCSETEGSRDPYFARAIGLNLDLLELQRPDTIEELIDMGLTWHDEIRGHKGGETLPVLWGIDSLDSTEAGRSAKEGLSEGGGWHFGGGRSEALAAGLRKVVKRCARYPTTLVMLNQTRDVVGGLMFGPKKRTSGGNPPHFYASLELMLAPSPLGLVRSGSKLPSLPQATLRRLGLQGDRGAVVGRWVRAKVTKTKLAPTLQQEVDFYIDFRKGVHRWGGLLPVLLRGGVVALDEDGRVHHRLKDTEEQVFSSQGEWLRWLVEHPNVLEG